MTVVPKVEGKPTLLISGMLESGGLEIYARVEQKLHEALIKAEFCAHLQVHAHDKQAYTFTRTFPNHLPYRLHSILLPDSITGYPF